MHNVKTRALPFAERAEHCYNPTAKQLCHIIAEKQSNLALSADVIHANQLFKLIDQVADKISLLKTHIDIIEDYTPEVTAELKKLAKQHNFLLFEDRKFADIGNTAMLQYQHGIYRIADWADITNCHLFPGEGLINGLKKVGLPKNRALLLLAEMSSDNPFFNESHRTASVELAKKHRDFVIGFICQQRLTDDPAFLHLTPGVQLSNPGDDLGQRYVTPEIVIGERGSDIIIVGRGITQAEDPASAAEQYRSQSWQAYCQ